MYKRQVYCYGEYQQLFRKYPLVTFHQGLPNIEDFDGSEPVLLVIHDLMNEADESVANLFTKGSHHRNVSVIFLVQNLFHKNRHVRTISLNSHYIVLFKNLRDASQFASLARQTYPHKSAFAIEAYKDATREPYGLPKVPKLRPPSSTSDRNRTKTSVYARTYFPERVSTFTCRKNNESSHEEIPCLLYTSDAADE